MTWQNMRKHLARQSPGPPAAATLACSHTVAQQRPCSVHSGPGSWIGLAALAACSSCTATFSPVVTLTYCTRGRGGVS